MSLAAVQPSVTCHCLLAGSSTHGTGEAAHPYTPEVSLDQDVLKDAGLAGIMTRSASGTQDVPTQIVPVTCTSASLPCDTAARTVTRPVMGRDP